MTTPSPEGSSINAALAAIVYGLPSAPASEFLDSLYAALVEREDGIKDEIRMVATNNGLILPFVNLALDHVGLGTPMTEVERDYAQGQMTALVAEAHERMAAAATLVTSVSQIPQEVIELIRAQLRAEIEAERSEGGET